MNKESLRKEIKSLNQQYEDIKEKIYLEKANGNLSKLYNLRNEFDETFDQFFDDKDLRKKYKDWDYEEYCIKFEKTAEDLLKEFDKEDLNKYIEFFKNYISDLECELRDLKEFEE